MAGHMQTYNGKIHVLWSSGCAHKMHTTPMRKQPSARQSAASVAPQRWHNDHTDTMWFGPKTVAELILAQKAQFCYLIFPMCNL